MDERQRNRRGCLIFLVATLIVIALFVAFFFLAPTSERIRSRSTGEAPVAKVDPQN